MDEKIYAVMPTANSRSHSLLIRNTINSFVSQTYENKHMIILTHGDLISDLDEPNVEQIQVDPATVTNKDGEIAVGLLRNIALDMLPDDTVWMVWDDDDWSHPNRMQEQYQYLIDNKLDACGMLAQIRHSIPANSAYRFHMSPRLKGCLQTMMWRTKQNYRYGDTKVREDTILFQKYEKVFKCRGWPAPTQYFIRFKHNDNLWLGTERDPGSRDMLIHEGSRAGMNHEEISYLEEVLAHYKVT